MNSRRSYHMCLMKEYFETLELKEGGVVHLRNDKALKVQGTSLICLRMFDNHEFILQDVRYVPKLKQNLSSKSMFDGLDYDTRISHDMIEISHVAKIIVQGIKMCGLQISYGSTITGYTLLASQNFHCKTELWHL
jgi:hypothetical protein